VAVLIGNSCNFPPGYKGFNLLSNLCDYFEIGSKAGDDIWLEGEMVGPGQEYLFNGRLYHSDGMAGEIIDSFPKAVPAGWTKRKSLDCEGYDLIDHNGELVFGYRINENGVCDVQVSLHRADGTIAAAAGQGGLVTQGVPVMVGRGGIKIG